MQDVLDGALPSTRRTAISPVLTPSGNEPEHIDLAGRQAGEGQPTRCHHLSLQPADLVEQPPEQILQPAVFSP